jgi:integrase
LREVLTVSFTKVARIPAARPGPALGISTVTRTHAILRKAFGDAVLVDELIPSSPVERAKRPKAVLNEPGAVWTTAQLRTFLGAVRRHRLFALYHLAAYTGARRRELLNLRWSSLDPDARQITISGSTGVVAGERIEGATRSGRSRVVCIGEETVHVLREHRKLTSSSSATSGGAPRTATCSRRDGVSRSIRIPSDG